MYLDIIILCFLKQNKVSLAQLRKIELILAANRAQIVWFLIIMPVVVFF